MPSIKGTASVSDDHAMAKLLRSTKFPSSFTTGVDVSKINIPVLSQWIEHKITSILGFDDEIVSSTAINLFLPTVTDLATNSTMGLLVDPRRAQLNLAGFLGDQEAASFSEELWDLLVDAQTTPTGIPRKLVEEKKQELARAQQQHQQQQNQQQQQHASVPNHRLPTRAHHPEMNRFVQEATRRAEAARQALAAARGPVAGNPVAGLPPPRQDRERVAVPVPISPPHSSEPAPIDNDPPARKESDSRVPDNEDTSPRNNPLDSSRTTTTTTRRNDSPDSSSSSDSHSDDSTTTDSEEERRKRHRRRRRRKDEEDRRRHREDDHRRSQHRRRSHREYDRDSHRRRSSRDRSRSYDREDRKRRRHSSSRRDRRTDRSYSDSD